MLLVEKVVYIDGNKVINFKGNHTDEIKNKHKLILFNDYVYNLKVKKYNDFKLLTCYFYNNHIKSLVQDYFKIDFKFAKNHNIKYELDNCINIEKFSNSKIIVSLTFFILFLICIVFYINKKTNILI